MPYIYRRDDGSIRGECKWPVEESHEFVEKDNQEFLDYKTEQKAGPTNEEIYDGMMQDKKLKAIVLSILDGSVKEGVTPQAAKTAILSKM